MWVFLTFVAKLLVLNNVCNDVEQLTFHVFRKKTEQCHTPCCWLEKCGVDDYRAWVIYSSRVSLFHSSLKTRCLWKPKPIWYAEDVFSYLWKLWRKYGGIIKEYQRLRPFISKITHAWVVEIPTVFERFICKGFVVFRQALWLWALYPQHELNYELWTECDVLLKGLESFDGADHTIYQLCYI